MAAAAGGWLRSGATKVKPALRGAGGCQRVVRGAMRLWKERRRTHGPVPVVGRGWLGSCYGEESSGKGAQGNKQLWRLFRVLIFMS